MKLTEEEILIFLGKHKIDLPKGLKGIRPEIINDIIANIKNLLPELIGYQKGLEESKIKNKKKESPEKTTYTVKEAAKELRVSETTLRDWIKKGKIKCTRFGATVRFSPSDLKIFGLELETSFGLCIQGNINIDKKSNEILPFEKEVLYEIVDENRIWITLYSRIWKKTAKFSKKEFNKYFKLADDSQVELTKYNLMEIG